MILVDINLSSSFSETLAELVEKGELEELGKPIRVGWYLGSDCEDSKIKDWIESDTILVTRDKDFKDYDNAIVLRGERIETLINQFKEKLDSRE